MGVVPYNALLTLEMRG